MLTLHMLVCNSRSDHLLSKLIAKTFNPKRFISPTWFFMTTARGITTRTVILFYFLNSLVNCGSIWNIKLLLNLVGRILKSSFFSATDRKQHGQVLKPLWMTKQNIIYVLFKVIIVINSYITVIIVIMEAKQIEIIKTSESIKIFLCSKQGFRKSLNWLYA